MKFISLFLVFLFQYGTINADIDCSIYSNDLEIINLNPFYVPLISYPFTTSVNFDVPSGQVRSFSIINDINPSSNIYCLKWLQTLTLRNTNLTILSDIKNFQNLATLIIETDNGTIDQHLPAEIGQLKSLSQLSLINIKNLEDLPNEIEYLTQLMSLALQNLPNFQKIPDESIGKLTKLYTLSLIDLPKLSNLPSTMENFQNLQQLELTNTNIDHLQLQNLVSLNDLKIKKNSILTNIQITDMLRLPSIDIQNNNQLLTLKLQNLSGLQSLTIASNTKLTSLEMENLSAISTISITDSAQLKTITLTNASRLTRLDLNSLSNFDSISFENAQSLTAVNIISSPLLKNIIFTNTPLINSIDLTGCQLTTFPESILTLKSLTKLTMAANQLSSLPSTLSTDLPNLQVLNLINNKFQGNLFQPPLIYIRELYLNNNSFTSLNGIEEYKSLQQIEVDFNNISTIPVEIMKLSTTLRILSINYNRLIGIPYQMSNLRSLQYLYIKRNDISQNELSRLFQLFQKTSIRIFFN
jgi:Leucine-rich repeat (LRR) protein